VVTEPNGLLGPDAYRFALCFPLDATLLQRTAAILEVEPLMTPIQ
jgi:hypothetical protein